MAKRSAGLLLYRTANDATEVLLVHPGGPYWARRDEGAWSLPKGEVEGDEDPLEVARREFGEELGTDPPDGPVAPLGEVRQAGGKLVTAWALRGDVDADAVRSNTFSLEWPPRSGTIREFPEVDRAGWFSLDAARPKLLEGQRPFLDRLAELLDEGGSGPGAGQPRRRNR
jgi:predicted NUDIX family NTP pyrophosphohydrolase